MKKELFLVSPAEESDFLNTYPLIRRIAARGLRFNHQAAEDIAQEVMCKLWQWRMRRRVEDENGSQNDSGSPPPPLSADDWCRLANTTTRNEIKTFFAAKHQKEVALPETFAVDAAAASGRSLVTRIEGDTRCELVSQMSGIWKSFLNLSFREKCAFALKERALCNRLILYGCCTVREIAAALEISPEEFAEIYRHLPLANAEIARLIEKKLGQPVAADKITKARQRARARIRRQMMTGNTDEYAAHDAGES